MKLGFAVAGFVGAAVIFLVAALIHVLRLNAVNAPLVLAAITSFTIGLVVHTAGLKGDAPPVL